MAILESFLRFRFLQHVVILLQIHSVICYQYKVGDLDSWGLPTSENPKIYMYWSKYHSLQIGDSLSKCICFSSSLKSAVAAALISDFHGGVLQCSCIHQAKIQ